MLSCFPSYIQEIIFQDEHVYQSGCIYTESDYLMCSLRLVFGELFAFAELQVELWRSTGYALRQSIEVMNWNHAEWIFISK